jgi:hypothetical protein
MSNLPGCGRRWRGHKCVESDGFTEPDAPAGDHTHRCLCGKKWVSRHPYFRSKWSDAGTCWCGRHEGAKTHA